MERTPSSTRSPRDGMTTEEHHRSFSKSPSFLRAKNDDDLGFISPAAKVLLIVRSVPIIITSSGGTKDMNLRSRIPVFFTDISLCSFRKHIINAERGERLPKCGERDFIRSTKKIDGDRRRVWTDNSRDDEKCCRG